MRVIDLTLPLYDGMNYYCTGSQPWEVIFEAEITFPKGKEYGLDLGRFTMYCEPGTRYLCVSPKKIGDLLKKELDRLVLKEAVLIRVPKDPREGGNPITAEEIKRGIEQCPARQGDAIILHTGHGDDEKYFKLGERWETWAPHMVPESAPLLADFVKKMECPLFGYDTPNISWQCTARSSLYQEWLMLNPRPEPNSPQAKEIAKRYVESGKFMEEFKDLLGLLRATDGLGGVVNLGEIKKERFKLIIAPLKVIDWGYVPATVYAIEE
jgi:kynurenine formamidase